jgi:hypothetical protein
MSMIRNGGPKVSNRAVRGAVGSAMAMIEEQHKMLEMHRVVINDLNRRVKELEDARIEAKAPEAATA